MSTRNLLSDPDVPSLLENIYLGRMSWELAFPFPSQDPDDRRAGSAVVERARKLVTDLVDADELDRTGDLPDGLVDELKRAGLQAMRTPPEQGGLGLSDLNAFRVVTAVAEHSTAVALVLAIDNAIGLAALAPALADGTLRDDVYRRLAAGLVTSSADTEPSGAANFRRATTATPDGADYVLSGEKLHVGNWPVAEMFSVSATVRDGGAEPTRMFVLDRDTPGVRTTGRHEFLGLRGFPNGTFRMDDVRVPADRMFAEATREHATRITPVVTEMILHGRLYLIGAPSLAISRLCAEWSRNFTNRRTIDGRPLGGYEKIRRLVAHTLADTFAIDSVTRWCLLAGADGRVNPSFEANAAKNITSVLCWRVVDRTMSLLAGEGLETAGSKIARGAPGLPLERYFRDARALRISGGVDFQIDFWTSQMGILSYYYPAPADARVLREPPTRHLAGALGDGLSERNRAHARVVEDRTRALARRCLELTERHPDPRTLYPREQTLILLSRWANELFTMAVVLGRAATLPATGGLDAQTLADTYCTGARERLDAIDRRLATVDEPDHAALSDAWLAGATLDDLLGDA